MSNINKVILQRIDEACQQKNKEEGRRKHLGASIIGQSCERQIWYNFRWAKEENHSGQLLRLFKRGHLEEHRFVEYLQSIGFKVYDEDENGKQFRISGCDGHFGGSCDGYCYAPDWLIPQLPASFKPNEPILTEYKTSGEKAFKVLEAKGMKEAKPEHWGQICTYGYGMDINWFIYMAVNKNTDHLYIEFGLIDKQYGKMMIDRANGIVNIPEPPMRRYQKTHFKCNWCNYKGICHFGKEMDKNCRSCKHVRAVENKQWYCTLAENVIPEDFVPKGCESWVRCDV